MPNRPTELFCIDILISIEKVKRYSRGFEDIQSFISHDQAYAATLRELEIIGEAMKHVLADPAFSIIIEKKWREIADFRNVLAHEYFGIYADEIFEIVSKEIHEFEFEFQEFFLQQANQDFLNAIKHVKKELEDNQWHHSLAYLHSIEKMIEL